MIIREARTEDIERILEIYDIAKVFMRQTGNPHQWNSRYPDQITLEEDIHKHQLFVMEEDSIIHSVFAFIIGEDPTYKKIEGAWLDHSIYGTIHRIASDGTMHQVFKKAVDFCSEKCAHLRADTHEDNKIMQKVILKNGFKETGIIYVEDGTPRIAYEKVK
ncbi:MAG: GNAT family N-acetyltransferase [Catenibacterium mitsuokai]|nr:GNAT family N-acetyltransferase [Catenibacterium mitsuokai]MBN2931343.1 GNAT family N-acetyltransferase [Catenibacterium mitsuokai]